MCVRRDQVQKQQYALVDLSQRAGSQAQIALVLLIPSFLDFFIDCT